MRSLASLATSIGILLHAVLGWCPQHVGCTSGIVEANHSCGSQHSCASHGQELTEVDHDSSTEHHHSPVDSDQPCCDHADCLFVSQGQSVQTLNTPVICWHFHALSCDELSEIKFIELRQKSTTFSIARSQGQAARISRCVWLI
jgi:hypothetical protein